MKIALVSLPKNEFRYVPIGLMRIAKHIKDNIPDVQVKLIDNTFEDIYSEIEKFRPEIIGVTTFTSYYQDVIDFSNIIINKYPETKIIVGGPHITTLPESLNKKIFCGVMGEGEVTMLEIVKAIRKKKSLGKIAGTVYYKGNKLVINKKRPLVEDLDKLHKMDYSLINKRYFEKRFVPEKYGVGVPIGIMTSIGCPYNCRFCSIKVCWNKIRFRKVDDIITEIKDLYDNYKVRHIDFYDDLFSINKQRLKEFYDKLNKAGLLNKVTFTCQARANMIDDEMCKLLKDLGIKTVVFGFESGSDRILKYIKNDPNLSIETNKLAIVKCREYGLNVFGCLIMGIPNETLEDIDETIKFIDFSRKNKASRIWTQILVPLPKTVMWEIAKKKGKIKDKDNNWREIHIHNDNNPILLDDNIPYEEFHKRYRIAKRKCRYFVYDSFIKTILYNPISIIYFIKESTYYIKRLIIFLRQ